MTRRFLYAYALPLAISCSFAQAKDVDQMCSEIASFAASVELGETHLVTLRGGWGGDHPNALMTHDCSNSGYGPGDALCRYLVPNTSWEFGYRNAMRAAACLDTRHRARFVAELERDVGKFQEGVTPREMTSSVRQLRDKTIHVTIRYYSLSSNLSALDISATRTPAE